MELNVSDEPFHYFSFWQLILIIWCGDWLTAITENRMIKNIKRLHSTEFILRMILYNLLLNFTVYCCISFIYVINWQILMKFEYFGIGIFCRLTLLVRVTNLVISAYHSTRPKLSVVLIQYVKHKGRLSNK
jgi:hypothetical protein